MSSTFSFTPVDAQTIQALQAEAVTLYDRLEALPAKLRRKQERKVDVVLQSRTWYKRLLWRLLRPDVQLSARLKPKKLARIEAAHALAFRLYVALGTFEEAPTSANALALEGLVRETKEFLR